MPDELNFNGDDRPFIVDDEGVNPEVDDILEAHPSPEGLETELARSRAALQMLNLRHELTLLKLRLQIMTERAKLTVAAQTHYVSSSAHEQLGDYPWAKLFAASCAAFIAGRIMRS